MVSEIGVEIVRPAAPDPAPAGTSGASGTGIAAPSDVTVAVDAREVPSAPEERDDDLNPDVKPAAARHRATCACDQPGTPAAEAPAEAQLQTCDQPGTPAAEAPAEAQLQTVTLEDIGPGFGLGGAPVLPVSDVAIRHAQTRSKRRFGSPSQVLCSRFVLIQVGAAAHTNRLLSPLPASPSP